MKGAAGREPRVFPGAGGGQSRCGRGPGLGPQTARTCSAPAPRMTGFILKASFLACSQERRLQHTLWVLVQF